MSHGEASARMDASLSNRELRRAELVDRLRDVVSAHAPDATYLFASAASAELLGYSPDELVGTSPYAYFHPDDLGQIEAAHRTALAAEPYTVSYRFRHKDGHYLWLETTGQVMLGPTGEISEILCSTRPIAERAEHDVGNVHDLRLRRTERALAEQSLEIHLQPIVNLRTHEPCAYEALARFDGTNAPPPDVWFSDAWSVGRGVELEMLAVDKALALLPEIPDDVGLAINVSPPTLGHTRFAEAVNGIEQRIRLEITEHLRWDPLESTCRHASLSIL